MFLLVFSCRTYGKPILANVVGARVKRTVFVKFATILTVSYPVFVTNRFEGNVPNTIRNVHILSRTSTCSNETCCQPWFSAVQYLHIANPNRKASNAIDVRL
jgi:hypothetical protein